MKFIITTQELNYLLNKCFNVVPSKPTIPILSNFLIEAINGQLIVTSTDLTVGVRCFTEAKILEEGATTISAKHLVQLVRELTSVNVEVSTNANQLMEVKADSSKFRLNGMSKTEYPNLPNIGDATHFKIKQSVLKDLLYRTSFAVSREDNRYVLTGVCLNIVNGKAAFIGTDGKRLAKSDTLLNIDKSFHGSFVIPLKTVDEIVKNLSEEGDATVFIMQDKIAVETPSVLVISKLLTGEYPDVERIIPAQSAVKMDLHREELISLLRQIALFAPENNHSVRFTFAEGELRLTANSMDVGDGKVSMPVNYQGERIEIAFNPNFFLDILRHTDGENVEIGITDPYSPGLLERKKYPDDKQEESSVNSLFVLMPMRLTDS